MAGRLNIGWATAKSALATVLAAVFFLLLAAAGERPARAADALSAEEFKKLCEQLIGGDHYKVRIQTAKALGMMRRNDAIPYLVRAMRSDPEHLVRATSAWALGAINNPGAIGELKRVADNEVPLVQKQAAKALSHILSSFPGNLSASSLYRIAVEGLGDKVSRDEELTKWIQHYFVEHLIKHQKRVELGTDMDIEADGEQPDVDSSFRPVVVFSLVGGIAAIDMPAGRAAGAVTVTIDVGLQLDPVAKLAIKNKAYSGKADFAGGPKPSDPFDDDPLVEAQKGALKEAVNGAYADLGKFLLLKGK